MPAPGCLTLKSFLTANAIRSTNSMTGIDWCSSNNSTPCAVGQIARPLLVAAMGGNTGLRDNEMLYEMASSRDKDFFVVEGATHNIEPCTECESRKGQYGNARGISSTTLPGGCRRGTDLRAR